MSTVTTKVEPSQTGNWFYLLVLAALGLYFTVFFMATEIVPKGQTTCVISTEGMFEIGPTDKAARAYSTPIICSPYQPSRYESKSGLVKTRRAGEPFTCVFEEIHTHPLLGLADRFGFSDDFLDDDTCVLP